MSSINSNQRRDAITALITDTLSQRVVDLRHETDEHWRAIANEILSSADIMNTNELVQRIMNDRQAFKLAFDQNDWHMEIEGLDDKNLRIRTVRAIGANGANGDETDPLGLECSFGSGTIADALRRIWAEAAPAVQVSLSEPMMILSTIPVPRDKPGVCSIVDPDEYDDTFMLIDVDDYIPSNCRTQRKFKARVAAIGDDGKKLYDSMMSATRNCRSTVSVIRVIPELGPYLADPADHPENVTVNVSAMLAKARG